MAARKGPPCMCRRCGRAFHKPPSAIASGQGKYCSARCYRQAKRTREDQRFWLRLRRIDEHRVFVGRCHPDGYGLVKHRGRVMFASRKAYILIHGDLSSNQYVMHGCDVPACCEPNHLCVGTIVENLLERNARGRQRVYADNHQLLRWNTRWTAGAGSVRVCGFRYDLEREVLVHYELPSGRTSWLERDVFLATFRPL